MTLLNRVFSTCLSSVGHILKLGVVYTNMRQRKTELVHFVLKIIFSQVIWHVGLVFWEEQLWLQNHHIWWQILSHFLVDEQSLLQNWNLQKLLCPFQKSGEAFPFSCPYISLENCSYGLLWLWSCHLAALHCWIFVEFFWWTLPSEFKTSNQSKLISSWIVSKLGHPQSYQNCAFMNFVSTPWIYWLLLCSQ